MTVKAYILLNDEYQHLSILLKDCCCKYYVNLSYDFPLEAIKSLNDYIMDVISKK